MGGSDLGAELAAKISKWLVGKMAKVNRKSLRKENPLCHLEIAQVDGCLFMLAFKHFVCH